MLFGRKKAGVRSCIPLNMYIRNSTLNVLAPLYSHFTIAAYHHFFSIRIQSILVPSINNSATNRAVFFVTADVNSGKNGLSFGSP